MKILASLIPLVSTKRKGVVKSIVALLVGTIATPTANAGGYCRSYSYPVVERRVEIVKKVVPVYQLEFVKIPVNALSYYPVSINSTYSTTVAADRYVTVQQPYAVPVAAAPIAYQPVYQQAVNYSNAPLPAKQLSCEEKLAAFEARMTAVIEKRLTGNFQATAKEYTNGSYSNGHVGKSQTSYSVMAQRCASCHDAKDNASKGAGFVFFDEGQPTRWDGDTRSEMLLQISDGRMPKNGTLSEADQSDIIAFIRSLPRDRANGSNGHSNGERPLSVENGNGHEKDPPADNPPRENGQGRKQ